MKPKLPRIPPAAVERVAATAARNAAADVAVESAFRLPTGEVVRTGAFHDLNKLPVKWHEEPLLSQVEAGFATPEGRFWTRKEAEALTSGGAPAPYGPYSSTIAGSRRAPAAPEMPPQSGHSDLWLRARAGAMRRHALNRTEAALERLASQAEREGGFTYSTQSGESPSRGFAFAASKANEQILDALSPEALSAYIKEHAAALSEPGAHLGAWRSPEGKWYLDVSVVEPDRERATAMARKAGQRALYDLGLGEEVPLP